MAEEQHELTPEQAAYIDYLLDPNRGAHLAWCQEWDVKPSTAFGWRKKWWFQEALRERMRELHLDPATLNDVLAAMIDAAKGGNVQAAKVVLGYVQLLQPPKPVEEKADRFDEMSDDELEAFLRGA